MTAGILKINNDNFLMLQCYNASIFLTVCFYHIIVTLKHYLIKASSPTIITDCEGTQLIVRFEALPAAYINILLSNNIIIAFSLLIFHYTAKKHLLNSNHENLKH